MKRVNESVNAKRAFILPSILNDWYTRNIQHLCNDIEFNKSIDTILLFSYALQFIVMVGSNFS
jgi:hypothetical protein